MSSGSIRFSRDFGFLGGFNRAISVFLHCFGLNLFDSIFGREEKRVELVHPSFLRNKIELSLLISVLLFEKDNQQLLFEDIQNVNHVGSLFQCLAKWNRQHARRFGGSSPTPLRAQRLGIPLGFFAKKMSRQESCHSAPQLLLFSTLANVLIYTYVYIYIYI